MNFDKAIERVLPHEGGLTLNPADRGNWTTGIIGKGKLNGSKYGISAMSYPSEDIKNLTWGLAKELYRRDFWDKLDADKLHDGVAYQLLDFAINSGVETAIKAYQRALGVSDDGEFGPISFRASQSVSESDQIILILAERLEFMAGLSVWQNFSKGWARRIAANLRLGAIDS